jgi:uncharacterized protein (DUF4415 family)
MISINKDNACNRIRQCISVYPAQGQADSNRNISGLIILRERRDFFDHFKASGHGYVQRTAVQKDIDFRNTNYCDEHIATTV